MTDNRLPSSEPASLDTLEAIAAFLGAAFDSGDSAVMAVALAQVAQAPAFPHLAAAASLPRDQLAAAFAAGEMSMSTTLAIMKVIDLHMPGDRH